MNEQKTYIRGVVFTVIGAICWGLSGVCSQYLFTNYYIDSSWLTAVRMLFSGAILLSLSLPRHKKEIIGILRDKKDRVQLIIFSIAGLLLSQYAFLASIQYSNSGTASFLESLNVVIMAVFISLKQRVLPEKKQLFSVILAVVGIYLIATNGNPYAMILSFNGLFWGIMAAFGAALYPLISQRIVTKWGNSVVTGWGMFIGGVAFGISVNAWNAPALEDIHALIVFAVIVLVGTSGAYSFFLHGVRYIGPVKATLIACLVPVTATIISAVWLHTSFNAVDIVGFFLILATVFLSIK